MKGEVQTDRAHEPRRGNPRLAMSKRSLAACKEHGASQVRVTHGVHGCCHVQNFISVIRYINKLKMKVRSPLSCKNALDKIQKLIKVGVDRNLINPRKDADEKPAVGISPNGRGRVLPRGRSQAQTPAPRQDPDAGASQGPAARRGGGRPLLGTRPPAALRRPAAEPAGLREKAVAPRSATAGSEANTVLRGFQGSHLCATAALMQP